MRRVGIEVGDHFKANSRKVKFVVSPGSFPLLEDPSKFPVDFTDFEVEHHYLKTGSRGIQSRLRKRGHRGRWTYSCTVRRPEKKGQVIEVRRKKRIMIGCCNNAASSTLLSVRLACASKTEVFSLQRAGDQSSQLRIVRISSLACTFGSYTDEGFRVRCRGAKAHTNKKRGASKFRTASRRHDVVSSQLPFLRVRLQLLLGCVFREEEQGLRSGHLAHDGGSYIHTSKVGKGSWKSETGN